VGNAEISAAAKELRKRQTKAEKTLWLRLRDNQINGAKFRRQEPIGSFIVDFVCYNSKLIIEVDGSVHKAVETKTNDIYRNQWLKSEGFKVLRFWNSKILNDLDNVVNKIRKNLVI
jgi:5-methyltetrahydrofolate--homocysteine methyltransferase